MKYTFHYAAASPLAAVTPTLVHISKGVRTEANTGQLTP